MAVRLVLFAVAVGFAAFVIAENTGPPDDVSVSTKFMACLEHTPAEDEDDCFTRGNWAQEHPELTGLIAGVAAFLVGAILIVVQSTGRRS